MKTNTIHLLLPEGKTVSVAKGTLVGDVARQHGPDGPMPVLAARVNLRLAALQESLEESGSLEWITYASRQGLEIYQQTASFILHMAVAELFHNTRLVIGHSIANGFYYDFSAATPVSQEMVDEILAKMREIVSRNTPFRRMHLSREEAMAYFRQHSMSDTLRLIENSPADGIQIYENGLFSSFELYPLAFSTGTLSKFDLKPFSSGFVMLFPDQDQFQITTHIGKTKKLFGIYRESNRWGQILEVNDTGRLNQIVANHGISELIKISESLHEKKIARIADTITENREDLRLILISGPSASGKTTFSKRLAIHLRVNGIRPLTLSLDNYFVDRALCPTDEKGELDFEALESVDIELFNDHLREILDGRDIPVMKFDFEAGKRRQTEKSLRLEDDQILIVEGIHCLNEKLTTAVPSRHKLKIYVSALTQLLLDDHHRISTTDTRILRRLVRDVRFRGYDTRETLSRFPSVIRGERLHVFPFQESADAMFNSALVYELAVLKDYALPLLSAIQTKEESYPEAQRLMAFLLLFQSVASDEVPSTSILREFIGGSTFTY